jgi:hypothetical protein
LRPSPSSGLKPTNLLVEVADWAFVGRQGLGLDFFFGPLGLIFKAGSLKAWIEAFALLPTKYEYYIKIQDLLKEISI